MRLSLDIGLGSVATMNAGGGLIAPPAWFDWTPSFSIRKQGALYVPSVTASSLVPATEISLYVSPTGNNANNGTTPALAKRSIASAYNAGATTILAAPGDYTRSSGFEGLTLANRDLVVINTDPTNGAVVIGRWEPPTSLIWTQNGTYPNVWSCTRSTAVAVRDRSVEDASGNIERLVPRASVQLCSENPGSQFITGSTVNVCLSDEREPDSDILVFLSGNNAVVSSVMAGKTLWVGEGVEFWGGDVPLATSGLATSDGTRIVCEGVKFKYGTSATFGNGILFSNLSESYLFDCTSENNNLDGFNYHYADGGQGFALEVNCIGRANGLTGGSNNGSTTHEDGRIIRLNGLYIGNEGPQMADINTAQSWNLGCRTSGGAVNYRTLDTAIMTLDNCISDDAETDIQVGAGSTVYTRNLTSGGVFLGTPTPY